MRNFLLLLGLGVFALNCAPKPTETIDLTKARASFQLTDGSSISDPYADDYSPVLVNKPDGTVVLVFSSDRDCGCATPGAYHVFVAESTDIIYYDGFEVFMPSFYDPVVLTEMGSELIVDPRSNLSATWNAEQLLIYANTGGLIQKSSVDSANIYLGQGNTLVPSGNTNYDSDYLMGFNHKEHKAISWNPSGVNEADFLNATIGTSISNDNFYFGDSIAQVPSIFTGFLDSYFIADSGRLYIGTYADDYGEHEDFNSALDYEGLYLNTISVHNSIFHSSDVVVFSAESGDGQTDLYAVTSHDASSLWSLTFVYGGDFQFNPGPYRMFVTSATTTGDMAPFGGVGGADFFCFSDANRPDINVFYKAMLADFSGNRTACTTANCGTGGATEHVDWVLEPNTTYIRGANGQVIQTTNADGLLPFALTTAIGTGTAWTGFRNTGDWLSATGLTTTCDDWTLTTNQGATGSMVSTSATMLNDTVGANCTIPQKLVCVEQPY